MNRRQCCGCVVFAMGLVGSGSVTSRVRPAPSAAAAAASAPAPRASSPTHRAATHEPAASAVDAPPFKRAHQEVADRPNRGGR